MVKGTQRRIIVVKSPDPKVFEEAIFIIRDDLFKRKGVSEQEIIREAQRVADDYIKSTIGRKHRLLAKLPAPAFAAAGAAATGIAWLAMRLVGA
ncbi:MAG: translation initiation factor 2 [Oscillospiraceae bacterium]|jgi:hypothetical protein